MAQSSPAHNLWTAPSTYRRVVLGLLVFSALSALGGGAELLVWPYGNEFFPPELLAATGFASFIVPGVFLGGVVGGTSAIAAVMLLRRSSVAIDWALLAGGALSVFEVVEIAIFRSVHPLHVIYGGLGLAILGLAMWAALQSRQPRHRWVVLVTCAEAVGFMVPGAVGILAFQARVSDGTQLAALTAAGFVEGLTLGIGQAIAFPLPVRRIRYVLLTALAAAFVWCMVMSTVVLAERNNWSVPLRIVSCSLAATLGLFAMGSAQWLELRNIATRAHSWIGWTALAWALALPISFAPSPLVDERTPAFSYALLWSSAGLVMAYVMSLVTWQGARRLRQVAGSSVTTAIAATHIAPV